MKVSEAIEKLGAFERTMSALGAASGLVYYDGATIAPKRSADVRPNTLGELSRISYELATAPETIEMLETLLAAKDELTAVEARQAHELYRDYDRMKNIPKDEFVEYQRLSAESDDVWHTAKETNDFALFEPYLQKMFDFNVRFAGYIDPSKKPYDVALDTYERGMTTEMCDEFFTGLREKLVPLIAKVSAAQQIDDAPLKRRVSLQRQRDFSSYLMDTIGIDRDRCIIGETEHPFTINFTKRDVRITTHYHEKAFASSMYSVIHEGGHALYELGTGDDLLFTSLGTGVSMAIHESQSRFYENIIGRSREFCSLILPYLKKNFKSAMKDVEDEQFYRMINRAEPSLIRTEADELTYCLHVMVRYELERAMFEGAISAKDLPREWNRLYKEYLGISVPDDRRGVLQDSHWANGNIGYFPSYALGSAYGAQLLCEMEKEFDVFADVRNGNFERINGWNCEHLWKHGCMYDPTKLFEMTCGKFNVAYYTDYLEKKFTGVYGI